MLDDNRDGKLVPEDMDSMDKVSFPILGGRLEPVATCLSDAVEVVAPQSNFTPVMLWKVQKAKSPRNIAWML
jgi:hypothetical protein